MTEEEAKAKWCPFARGMMDNGGNRVAYGTAKEEPESPDCRDEYAAETAMLFPCIGSACMAWRVTQAQPAGKYAVVDRAPTPENPHYAVLESGEREHETPAIGYCGLAGKP